MRVRKTLSGASLAAFVLLGAVACASGGSSGGASGTGGSGTGGDAGALDPSGGTPAASAPGTASSSDGASGLRSFAFPAGVQVQFQTSLPASGTQRAAMIGYENYVDSLWSAVSSPGSQAVYQQYMAGNALTFAKSLISEFRSGGYKLSGTIVYYDITVPHVYYGAGAVVESCVDTSGLYMVNATTGKTGKPVFDTTYQHYQEQAADGKSAAGHWTVSHTENFPASGGASAGECV